MKNASTNQSEIIRVIKKDRFAVLSHAMIRDSRMSFEARGALAYILSKPDDWQITIKDLSKEGGIGRDKTYAILKEWALNGYFIRLRKPDGKGRFTWESTVYEEPQTPVEHAKPEAHSVYLMLCGPFYKIGVAVDVKSRLGSVQAGNPYQVALIKAVDVGNHQKALDLEKSLHQRFLGQRKSGEWFRLSPTQVQEVIAILDPLPGLPQMVLPIDAEPHPAEASTAQPPAASPQTNERPTDEGSSNLLRSKVKLSNSGARARRSPVSKRDYDAIIRRTWEKWQNRLKDVLDTGQYKLTPARRTMMRDRLDFGWTEENLGEGIEGLRLSDWHMARHPDNRKKKYLAIEYIFKDDETLEKRIFEYREWKKSQPCGFCNDTGFIVVPAVVPETATAVPSEVWTKALAEIQLKLSAPAVPVNADPQTQTIWQSVVDQIKTKIQPESFETWFSQVRCLAVDHPARSITLSAPNKVVSDWITANYANLLDTTLGGLKLSGYTIAWQLGETAAKPLDIVCAGVNCDAVYLKTSPDLKNSLSGKRPILESVIAAHFGKRFEIKWLLEKRMSCNH